MTTRIAVALAVLLAPAAAGADYYQYVTEGGVVAFTDDPERIPKRYADEAVRNADRSLTDYERLTVSEPGAATESAATSLDPQALDAQVAAERARPALAGDARVKLQLDDSVELSVDPNSDEPIYVDRRRYLTRHGITTPHTVVSQGDKPLVVISDRPR